MKAKAEEEEKPEVMVNEMIKAMEATSVSGSQTNKESEEN
jgi:hypothetical protein